MPGQFLQGSRFVGDIGCLQQQIDHLLFQLHLSTSDAEMLRVGTLVIGNIDESGYLAEPLEKLSAGPVQFAYTGWGVVRILDEWAAASPGLLGYFGGKSLVTQSHGQSMMAFFQSLFFPMRRP